MKKTNVKRTTPLLGALALAVCTGLTASAATEAHAAVRARFSEGRGLLTIVGDREDNVIVVKRTSGLISVNGGAIPIVGGVPTVGNTKKIVIRGGGGNDRLELDESTGALPAALLNGGPGNDRLIGGSGDDDLRGGPGRDTLVGGRGNDRIRGDAGDDIIDWRGGDGSDVVDGGAGSDRLQVFAAKSRSNDIRLFPEARKLHVTLDEAVPVSLQTSRLERVLVFGGDLTDVITAAPDLGKGVTLGVYGGNGNDVIVGSDGADLLNGNGGHDTIYGMGGDDTIYGESGDDVLLGGEGNDYLDGDSGTDVIDGGPGVDVAVNGETVTNVP